MNFDNKLKGLETNPDYPREKPWYFKPGKDTKADYNILSNIPMTEHHFAAPEKRPPQDEEKVLNTRSQFFPIEAKNKENDYNWIKRLQHNNWQIFGTA